MKKIVLLGKTGFIGSHLWSYLTAAELIDHFSIYAPSSRECDITHIDSIRRCIEAGDIVINASGYANATDRSKEGVRKLYQANILGVNNIATICVEKKVSQLVHISSVAAMGRLSGLKIGEGEEGVVDSPYAQSKRDGEQTLYSVKSEVNVTILRPTSIIGRGRGLTEALIKIIKYGWVPLPNGGKVLLPLSYVGNLVKAVGLVLGNPNCYGKTYIVGDPRSYVLREVVEKIIELTKSNSTIISVPRFMTWPGAFVMEMHGRLTGRPPLLDRWRLENLITPVQYDISAIVKDTGYVVETDIFKALETMLSGESA